MRCSGHTDTNLAQRASALDLDEGLYTERSILLPGILTLAAFSIVAECTKAVPVDFHTDFVGTGVSGKGNKTKGKRGEWEKGTDGIVQILRTFFSKHTRHFIDIFTTTFCAK